MAQTHLVREGMRPLTQGFADAYRAWSANDQEHSPRYFHPLDKRTTPEQFAEALKAIGIRPENRQRTAREALGRALGVSAEMAGQILKDPANKLNEEAQGKLVEIANRKVEEARDRLRNADRELWEIEDNEGDTAEAERLVVTLEKELFGLDSAAALLGMNWRESQAQNAAREEFPIRALVEGYLVLTDKDRTALLRMLMGLLDTYHHGYFAWGGDYRNPREFHPRRRIRANFIASLLHKTDCGAHAFTHDLFELVKDPDGSQADELAVLGEYAGWTAKISTT